MIQKIQLNYFQGCVLKNENGKILYSKLPKHKCDVIYNGSIHIGWFTIKEIEYMRRYGFVVTVIPIREIMYGKQ